MVYSISMLFTNIIIIAETRCFVFALLQAFA